MTLPGGAENGRFHPRLREWGGAVIGGPGNMDIKHILLLGLVLLTAASVLTDVNLPSHRRRYPVLHWVTDDNPARVVELAPLKNWLRRHRYPMFTVHLDFANDDMSKFVIQGVSGDADTLVDTFDDDLDYLHDCNLLYNLTPDAKKMGFDLSHTYPAVKATVVRNGRQYLYPTNVNVLDYWVNKAAFAKYHQPPPPRTWTFAEFQRIGRAFVRAANPPGRRPKVFFTNSVDTRIMRRSLGLSAFNETLTRCTLADPRYVRVLRLMYRWTFVDHLLPTPAEEASFATHPGYGGPDFQMFNNGQFAMLYTGRWMLIQLRKFYKTTGPVPLAVCEPPYGNFPNALLFTRATGIYIGSPRKKLAEYFLKYLTSRAYNMQIIRDGDAEPPNPVYARSRRFLDPPQYPNEWGCTAVEVRAIQTIAIPRAYSPFVLPWTVSRIMRTDAEAGFMAGIYTARQAASLAADRINRHIIHNIRHSQRLRRLYDKLRRRQKIIDCLRKEKRKVPLRLITNPFYRRYYVAKGWAR